MKLNTKRLRKIPLNSLGFPQNDGDYEFIKEIYAIVDTDDDCVFFYECTFQANTNKEIVEMINKQLYQKEVRKLENVFIPHRLRGI